MDIQVLYYHVNVHNAINFLMYHTCTHVYYCSCLVLNQSGKWQVITLDTCCSFTRHQIVKYTSITLTMFHHDSCNNTTIQYKIKHDSCNKTTIQYKIKTHPINLKDIYPQGKGQTSVYYHLVPLALLIVSTQSQNFFFFGANLPIFDSLGSEMWCLQLCNRTAHLHMIYTQDYKTFILKFSVLFSASRTMAPYTQDYKTFILKFSVLFSASRTMAPYSLFSQHRCAGLQTLCVQPHTQAVSWVRGYCCSQNLEFVNASLSFLNHCLSS